MIVRDSGVGIRPRADVEQPSLRLGLSLIAALSSSFSFSGGLDRGTEVEMRLPLQGGGAARGRPADGGRRPRPTRTEIVVGRTELLAPVLARVVGALAARRDLSVDRVSDAVLLTDAIAAAAPGRFADGSVRLSSRRRRGRDRAAARPDGGRRRRGDPRGAQRCRTSAAPWRPSPTSSASRARPTATTSRSASALLLLLLDLLADFGQGAAQDARDVHLGVADLIGDLRLGHVVDEAQAQDQALALVEVRAGPSRARPGPRPARSSCPPRRSSRRAAPPRSRRRRPAGRARAAGGCGWPRAPRGRRSARVSSRSAISATEGERCSFSVSAEIAFSTWAMRSWRPRGTRTVQARSRKWRLSSPRIVGEAKALNGMPRSGSKRSTALTRARLATWSRSSKDSLAPR